MKTASEVRAEVVALQRLIPSYGKHKKKTVQMIYGAIFGLTADPAAIVMVIESARWKAGKRADRPSEGWGALVRNQRRKEPSV